MMRGLLLSISLIIFLQASGQQAGDPFLRAKALMAAEDYVAAIPLLDQALESDKGNVEALFNRGMSYFMIRQYNKALQDFVVVNKRRPAMASLMLAKTEARLNHPDIAVKFLREHLGSYYKLPEKDILLDEDLATIEYTDAWIALWREKEWYSTYDKELQEIMYLKENGEELESINRLRALDKKGFKRSFVNQQLAELYLNSGNKKAAMDALDRAISSDTRNLDALKLRIDLLVEEEKYDLAKQDCARLLRQSPDAFDYYLVAGKIHSSLDEYEIAKKSVETYLELYPESHLAYNALGEIQFEHRKFLDALGSFNKALEMEQGTALYYYNRGRTYASTRTHRYAEKDFSMALDLDPRDPDIWFAKGLTDLELGNTDTACFDFRMAFQYGKYEARDYLDRHCGN